VSISKAELARREERARIADSWLWRAVTGMVTEGGGQLVPRPVFRGREDLGTVRDAGPADGLAAARALEIAARLKVQGYIRDAREEGMGWKRIGELLNLQREAERQDITVADAAFDLAAGPRDSNWAMTYGRTFRWDCASCGQKIDDEGPESWPGDFRHGHGTGCRRLAAEVRAYNRQAGA
jgi:hypothetical protein